MRVIGKRRQRTTTTTRFGAGATRAAALAVALATADTAAADSGAGFDREHTAWTSLVRRYVSDGLVDYAALKRDGRPSLDAYLRSTPVAIWWSPPPYPIAQARLDKSGRLVDAWYAVPAVRRAKQILQVVGISFAAIGAIALPFPRMNPKALTQSLFERLAMMGAFTRPGLILILVGLGCLAVAALLPSDRQ